jgi:O-antigen/teichoic acid export membrane protein
VTGAVILDWPSLAPAAQGFFAALLALAAYTVWRGWRARNKLAARRRELSAVDDVGFTLITLFVGFVVILVNDLGGPAWLIAVFGILAILAGRRAVVLIKARRHPSAPSSPGRAP